MEQAIRPIGEKPLLVRQGATFTRIVVSQVQAADGEKYHVMFIGTGEFVQRFINALPLAVNTEQLQHYDHGKLE